MTISCLTQTNMNEIVKNKFKKRLTYCNVPGCDSKTADPDLTTLFYKLPKSPVKRKTWCRALHITSLPKNIQRKFTICYKHFEQGYPSDDKNDQDWIPHKKVPSGVLRDNAALENIIKNVPEVEQSFDMPEYIVLDKIREKQIENHLVSVMMEQNSVEPRKQTNYNTEHNYSISQRPACEELDTSNFCNICGRNCYNLFRFNSHMAGHIVENDVQCQICDVTFLTSTCLNVHLTQHTALCDGCGYRVPTTQIDHHRFVNRRQKFTVYRCKISEKDLIYFCVICKKGFKFVDYRSHMLLHH